MGSPSALAASRVARRRSRLHVSTSRGARRPRTRPSTAPSTRSMKAREAANSRRPAAPASEFVPRPEIGAPPEVLHLPEQRVLHAELAAKFHERGDAVAQELGH